MALHAILEHHDPERAAARLHRAGRVCRQPVGTFDGDAVRLYAEPERGSIPRAGTERPAILRGSGTNRERQLVLSPGDDVVQPTAAESLPPVLARTADRNHLPTG